MGDHRPVRPQALPTGGMMRVYISGPIAGMPNRNEEAFRQAATYIESLGHKTLVPHDIPAYMHMGACPPGYAEGDGHSSACWIRNDLIQMLMYCQAIYFLAGWEMSRGARAEHLVGTLSGLQLFYDGALLLGISEIQTAKDTRQSTENGVWNG